MNLSTGTVISQLPTGTSIFGNDVFPFTHGITGSATPQTQQASLTLLRVSINQGHIQENAAQLTYVTGTSYRVEAGSADINGTWITWGAALTRSSLSFTSGTMNYVYMGASGTSPFLEESTTVPVWSSPLNYYQKTGDSTRRCLGFLQASTTNTIRKFLNVVYGRTSEFFYTDGGSVNDKTFVNSGNATGSWASFSMSPVIPAHATHWYCAAKLIFAGATDDGTLGISPIDLGSSLGSVAPYTVRQASAAAGTRTFFGRAWLPITETQTNYYRLQWNVGTTTTATIEGHGARITR